MGDQTYLPYGDERSSSGALGTERQFTGQRFDGGSGLYFYNARYYDPKIGRFISADTIIPAMANPQAWNRYAYVLNNPLRYTDPTGRNHMGYGDLSNAGNYYRAQTTRSDEFGFCGCWTATDLSLLATSTPKPRSTRSFTDRARSTWTGIKRFADRVVDSQAEVLEKQPPLIAADAKALALVTDKVSDVLGFIGDATPPGSPQPSITEIEAGLAAVGVTVATKTTFVGLLVVVFASPLSDVLAGVSEISEYGADEIFSGYIEELNSRDPEPPMDWTDGYYWGDEGY